MSEQPDYTKMTEPQLLEACGANAFNWAEAFCQHNRNIIDQGLMITWFANAIETAIMIRSLPQEPTEEMLAVMHEAPRYKNLKERNRMIWRAMVEVYTRPASEGEK